MPESNVYGLLQGRPKRNINSGERDMLASSKLIAFIPSADLARARAFFERVLGLRFVSEDPFAVVFDAAGVMLRVVNVQDFKPAPFTILGWTVPDIERYAKALQARGVAFLRYPNMQQDALGIWTSPSNAKVAWFHDSDGNVLSLTEFASGKPKKKAGKRRKRG
jgi:catechol 2,3-dioxygenase-like lactoylglutathione lyase family enzyme